MRTAKDSRWTFGNARRPTDTVGTARFKMVDDHRKKPGFLSRFISFFFAG